MKYYLLAILFGLIGLSGCGDAGTPTRANNFTPLTSIEISAGLSQIANETSTPLRAIGNFSGLFTRDITADVVWDAPTLDIISNAAGTLVRARGKSVGRAAISATLDGLSGTFDLEVSSATLSILTIDPLLPTRPKGLTAQFTATGSFSDATTQDISFDVVWDSTDPLKATISNALDSMGLASTVNVGNTEISATFAGTSASTTMTVSPATLSSMVLSPATPSILSLSSGQMTAIGTFSDASTLNITDQVTWASAFPAIATISNTTGSQGLVTTLLNGFTTISATLAGKSAETLLSVTGGDLSAIGGLPATLSHIHIDPFLPLKLTAQGIFPNAERDISKVVTWSSSNLAVATINSSGVVTTVGPGSTLITAVYGVLDATTDLSISAATFTPGSLTIAPLTIDLPTIASATRKQFTASGTFSDGLTRDLTAIASWSSSATAIATVGDSVADKGVAVGVSDGLAGITADYGGDSATSDLTVTAPSLVSVLIDTLPTSKLPGQSLQFTATATYLNAPPQDVTADVAWSSADTSVAIFHDALNAPGEILAVDSGSVTLTASFGGQTDTLIFTVP